MMSYDVVVYGATPSGITAALAVQREGRSVVIVEPGRWLGGILGAGIKPRQDCPDVGAVGGWTLRCMDFEPHPAGVRKGFAAWLAGAGIEVIYEQRVIAVEREGTKIVSFRTEHASPDRWGIPPEKGNPAAGAEFRARVFIDASYEGDLMAQAGVSYSVGRESHAQYGEQFAGVQPFTNVTPIDPYRTPGDPASGLVPLVEADHGLPGGSADDYTQAYNYRFYVTADPAARVPFTPPDDYRPETYEVVGRYVEHLVASGRPELIDRIFPGWLNEGEYNYYRESLVTIAPLGVSRTFQDADYAVRSRLWRQHADYLRGLHHFMSTDARVPAEIRARTAALGLERWHHPETEGWPHQLYIRIARRMNGPYVLTEANVRGKAGAPDSVGLGQYGVDTYPVRRVAVRIPDTNTMGVATEGNMWIGGAHGAGPYPISYRAITPKAQECGNLLVPVSLSASYIAYASVRMEPTFMVLGESAGVAAALALAQGSTVQDVGIDKLRARLREVGQKIDLPRS
ncbi:MAG TPA: FAD-dependent oxidoreductase [Kiritimatiellia bacterium]|nr:FAD-dependent oxidoreductase [Kiritimatiellia bacterium]